MRVMLVVGARPQIVESAPIVQEASEDAEVKFQRVYTEQRYARKAVSYLSPVFSLGITK